MPTTFVTTPEQTVLSFDGTGFDATRTFSPTIVKVGGQYTMLYGGLPFGNDIQVGLAYSSDGISWTKYSDTPVISHAASQPWASFREVPTSMIYANGEYMLWLYGDNSNLSSDSGHGTGFGLATSPDGVNWSFDPNDPIRFELNSPAGNGAPLLEVVQVGATFHAYYLDLSPGGNILYHATSSDGVNFANDQAVSLPAGDQFVSATVADVGGTPTVIAVLTDQSNTKLLATSTNEQDFTVLGPTTLSPNFSVDDIQVENGLVKFYGDLDVGNVNWGFGNEVIAYATMPNSAIGATPLPPTSTGLPFFDDFNRADGTVGNGWSPTAGDVGGYMLLSNGALSQTNPGGEVGVYRPLDLTTPVTISATLTPTSGYGGVLYRYVTAILVGSSGDRLSGYGLQFDRGDQNYNDSSIVLLHDGVQVDIVSSTFQFTSAITPTFTISRDGSIAGSVTDGSNVFNFNFGPHQFTDGGNLAILEDGPDPRSNSLVFPTVDNVLLTATAPSVPPAPHLPSAADSAAMAFLSWAAYHNNGSTLQTNLGGSLQNPAGSGWSVVHPLADLGVVTDDNVFDGFYEVTFDITNSFLKVQAAAIVAVKGDTLSLSFRGSDRDADPSIFGSGDFIAAAKDQANYYSKYSPLLTALHEYIANHPNITKLIVSGHSLGGAMAEWFAFNDAQNFANLGLDISIATFGSPGTPVPGASGGPSPVNPTNAYVSNIVNYGDKADPVFQHGKVPSSGAVDAAQIWALSQLDGNLARHGRDVTIDLPNVDDARVSTPSDPRAFHEHDPFLYQRTLEAFGDSPFGQTFLDGLSSSGVPHFLVADTLVQASDGNFISLASQPVGALLLGESVAVGGSDNDILQGGLGDDWIDGGPGYDTAIFTGPRSDYTITQTNVGGASALIVTDRPTGLDGTDTLMNVEALQFADQVQLGDTGASYTYAVNGLGSTIHSVIGGAGVDTVNIDSLVPLSLTGGIKITPNPDGSIDVDIGRDGTIDLTISAVEDISVNGQQVIIAGNFTGTALAYQTITYTGDVLDDTFDASQLVSAHDVVAMGFEGADLLKGGAGADTVAGGGGNDTIDGGSGEDTAVFSGAVANYSIVLDHSGAITVADLSAGSPDGTDTLTNIEHLQFADQVIDVAGLAPANAPPTAVTDTASTPYGTPLVISAATLLANDTDPDSDALSITAVGGAQHGTGALNGDQVIFTPYIGYTGPAAFSYTVDDGHGGTATAQVSVSVTGSAPAYLYLANDMAAETVDLTGDGAHHNVLAGSGDTTILVGSGGASAHMGAGTDTVIGSGAKDVITFGSGLGTATGGGGGDTYILVEGQVADPSSNGGLFDTVTDYVGSNNAFTPGGDFIWFKGFAKSSTVTYEHDLVGDPNGHVYMITDGAYHAEFVLEYAGAGHALHSFGFM